MTTGGPPRLNETLLDNKIGVKNKNEWGGNWEASQGLLMRDSNSRFFIPSQQADMKMLMRYTQPLMRGAGKVYNRATITIAEFNTAAAAKDANQALQAHVMDLTESYWLLYLHRAQLLQISRGINELTSIADNLRNRRDLDLVENQLLRAVAAVNTLQSRHARTNAEIIKDEENLRRLVNAPWIQHDTCLELIPGSMPIAESINVSTEWELAQAMVNRPEILSIRDTIDAAYVKQKVAKNDLRPTLNLVTDFYIRGLNGNYDVANSFADQYANGRPSYSGGVEYLRPKNQTQSRAVIRQRNLEIQQLVYKLDDQLLQVSKEVRGAIGDVNASYAELQSSIASTLATKAEYEYLEARWESGMFLDPNKSA